MRSWLPRLLDTLRERRLPSDAQLRAYPPQYRPGGPTVTQIIRADRDHLPLAAYGFHGYDDECQGTSRTRCPFCQQWERPTPREREE